MGYILCGLSNNLSVQTSDSNRFFDHWSLIHRNVSIIVWCSPHHVPYPGNQRERFSSNLHEAMCLLQGLWGKFRSFRTRSAPKAAPTHQTYQHVLSSFLQAHVKWINQNLSNWHWISDYWCLNQGSSSKRLPTSSSPHLWPMSMLKLPLWWSVWFLTMLLQHTRKRFTVSPKSIKCNVPTDSLNLLVFSICYHMSSHMHRIREAFENLSV